LTLQGATYIYDISRLRVKTGEPSEELGGWLWHKKLSATYSLTWKQQFPERQYILFLVNTVKQDNELYSTFNTGVKFLLATLAAEIFYWGF
jgi:hypothetical protein